MKTPKLPLVVLLSLLLLAHITCKKESKNLHESTTSKTTQLEKAPKQPDGPRNYCQGCGNSTDPHFGCEISEIFVNGLPLIQCVGNICPGTVLLNSDSIFQNSEKLNSIGAYYLRNNYGYENEKLKKYIQYGNYIAKMMIEKNTINSGNFSDHIKASNLALESAIKYFDGKTDDVIVNQELVNVGLKLTKQYRSLNLGRTMESILDSIDFDLMRFNGLTKKQIAPYVEY
jgi:hypothetical protein